MPTENERKKRKGLSYSASRQLEADARGIKLPPAAAAPATALGETTPPGQLSHEESRATQAQARATGVAPAPAAVKQSLRGDPVQPAAEATAPQVAPTSLRDAPAEPQYPEGTATHGAEYDVPQGEVSAGVENLLQNLPAHMRNQPRYRKAAENMIAGPAGIRTGSMIRTAAVDTGQGAEADRQERARIRGFSQMDSATAQTLRNYQPQDDSNLTPRELEARRAAQPQQPSAAGPFSAAPVGVREPSGPSLSEQNEIGRRYAAARRQIGTTAPGGMLKSQRSALARLTQAEGEERAALRASYRPAASRAGTKGSTPGASDSKSLRDQLAVQKGELAGQKEQRAEAEFAFEKQKTTRDLELKQESAGFSEIEKLYPDEPRAASQIKETFAPLLSGSSAKRTLGRKSIGLLGGLVRARKESGTLPFIGSVLGIGVPGRPGVSGLGQVSETFSAAAEALQRYKGTKTTDGDPDATFDFAGEPTKISDMDSQTRSRLEDIVKSGEIELLKRGR